VSVGPLEIVIVLVLALLVFGPKRLPQAGRSLGQAMREFRKATQAARTELGLDEVVDEFKGVKDGLASDFKSAGVGEVMSDLKTATTIPLGAAGMAKGVAKSVVAPPVDKPVPVAAVASDTTPPEAAAGVARDAVGPDEAPVGAEAPPAAPDEGSQPPADAATPSVTDAATTGASTVRDDA
jgi:TatA/E family protein of Tat protein translocase